LHDRLELVDQSAGRWPRKSSASV